MATPARMAGVGVFVLGGSQGTYIYGNVIANHPEYGVLISAEKGYLAIGTCQTYYNTISENSIYNNIFNHCGRAGIVILNRRNEADGNVYVSMPAGYLGFFESEAQRWLDLPAWRDSFGWDKNGVPASLSLDFDADKLELTMDGRGLPSVEVFDQIDTDIFGKPAGNRRAPGPIINPGAGLTRHIDPRVTTEVRK